MNAAVESDVRGSNEVERVWRECDAVCFDVDSTVCRDEGIDELAAFLGKAEEVAAWTTKAMDGGVSFREALRARLELISPSSADVDAYLASSEPKLSDGMVELAATLQQRRKEVFLVSGGFRQMIEPVAAILGIDKANIYANRILFDSATGAYSGFDEKEYTSESGGKARALLALKAERGFESIAMVGDGATDAEAKQPGAADIFIGYGGNAARESVKQIADWYVYDLRDLTSALRDDQTTQAL